MMALTAAIVARFNATSALNSLLAGGIHQDSAPVGTAFDYLTFKGITYATKPVYDAESMGQLLVQFSIWTTKGGAQAGAIADQVVATYGTVFPMTRGGLTNAVLNNTPIPRPQPKLAPDGSQVVMCPVEILYSFELG